MGSDDALGLGEGTHLLRRRQRARVDDFEAEWRQRVHDLRLVLDPSGVLRVPAAHVQAAMGRAQVVGQEACSEPGDDPGRGAQVVVGQRRHDELVGPDVRVLLVAQTAVGREAEVVEHVALEPGGPVHEIRVGLRAGPSQQLEARQDVQYEVVVVVTPPRGEDAHRAGDLRQRGRTATQEDWMLRRRGRAVVRREVEQERVVLRHHRRVGRKHAPAPDGGDDVGRNVCAPMCRELWVVGGEARRKRPVQIHRGGHLHDLDATVGMGPCVVGRRARHVARRRGAGQASGERADRLGGAQDARFEPWEERAQSAGEPRHGRAPSASSAKHLA